MDPLTIAAGLLGLWGLSKVMEGRSELPITIPPTEAWPTATPVGADCPPNLPVPVGLVAIKPPWPSIQFSAMVSLWGYEQLRKRLPLGARVIDTVAGVMVVGRVEWHYHPPGSLHVTATGCHHGLSVYRPTGPWVQIG